MNIPIIGIKLEDYELNTKGIPLCLDLLVSCLQRNKEYLSLEGIFRKNASQSEEAKIEEILEK